MPLTLVTGPRRSGKSRHAERLARDTNQPVIYLATLHPEDDEMRARVIAHQQRRPPQWTTRETTTPAQELTTIDADATVLLDSLGTWLSTRLHLAGALDDATSDEPQRLATEAAALATAAATRTGHTIVVAEEAGWGPVPPHRSTRLWLDLLGDAVQALSAGADHALLVVAGRVIEL